MSTAEIILSIIVYPLLAYWLYLTVLIILKRDTIRKPKGEKP